MDWQCIQEARQGVSQKIEMCQDGSLNHSKCISMGWNTSPSIQKVQCSKNKNTIFHLYH